MVLIIALLLELRLGGQDFAPPGDRRTQIHKLLALVAFANTGYTDALEMVVATVGTGFVLLSHGEKCLDGYPLRGIDYCPNLPVSGRGPHR
jgi:hypothetical protein